MIATQTIKKSVLTCCNIVVTCAYLLFTTVFWSALIIQFIKLGEGRDRGLSILSAIDRARSPGCSRERKVQEIFFCWIFLVW